MTSWRRRLQNLAYPLLLFVICVGIGSYIYRQRDFTSHFHEKKGELSSSTETVLEQTSGASLQEIELSNDRALTVKGLIFTPASGGGKYPVLILLGGLRTGRHVLDYTGALDGTILLALDYPYDGKKDKMGSGEFIWNLPKMRNAVMNTVPSVMLAIDYLLTRKDVDVDRITLVGGSIGALIAPAIAASDERITAVALLFGAADLQTLIEVNIDLPFPLPALAAWLGGTLLAPVEPSKYIGRISPRPLFMLNGREDPRMPERCSRLLQDKAGEPKTIRWIDAGHIHIRDKEFQHKVRVLLEEWLKENRLIPSGSAGPG